MNHTNIRILFISFWILCLSPVFAGCGSLEQAENRTDSSPDPAEIEKISILNVLNRPGTAIATGMDVEGRDLLYIVTTNKNKEPVLLFYHVREPGMLYLIGSRNLKYDLRLRDEVFLINENKERKIKQSKPSLDRLKKRLGKKANQVSFLEPSEPVRVKRWFAATGAYGEQGDLLFVGTEDNRGRQKLLVYRPHEKSILKLAGARTMEFDRRLTDVVYSERDAQTWSLPPFRDIRQIVSNGSGTESQKNSKESEREKSGTFAAISGKFGKKRDGLYVLTTDPTGRNKILFYTVDRSGILRLIAARSIHYDREIFNVIFRRGISRGGVRPPVDWLYKYLQKKGYLDK